ncbi:hypothetical protein GUA46_02715 [Muricauda sp. HICW]|uniref:Outer membrane protein beta-barrel domain-containing protein n=1 Tax=Flagellimonas chongwuensis TaxID=2697365 RepID=A0A850NE72_9FLAO|nr:hypothetical protein [Allomuricauda chongwuensis]NVN17240.1 hypothetical protein [Allomuricauda chongwuensis]
MKMRILLFLFLLPLYLAAQDNSREKNFFLNLGAEYRITPIYKSGDQALATNFINPDLQNSGPALNFGVDYYVTQNFSAGFKTSFRYDLITTRIENTASETERGLMFGYHFNLNYHFQVFQKGELFVGAGLSLLNRNSEYVRTESILNEEGEVVGSNSSLDNYNFSANKIFVGYGKGRSKIMLGIYISRNTKYFDKKTTFILPFISYSFNLVKLSTGN